jgi:basic membrane protein A
VAGKATKANLIGFVAAVPIPEVVRDINAFTLGARSVNPAVRVRVVWVNAWYDPAREREAANTLIDAGADVVAHFTNSAGPLQAAEARGVHGVTFHADMSQYGPKAFLVASVWNWCPIFVRAAQGVRAGTWKSTQIWASMAEGVVDISKFGPDVPQSVQDQVLETRSEIIKGSRVVFAGPIKNQAGEVKVPAGKAMSDAEMLSFNWFVEGVEGTIPK